MRHLKGYKKLNRTSSHRKAMLVNMCNSLLRHEQIKTTLPKAKTLRPFIEKIITKARNNNLHTLRYLNSILHDKEVLKKLITEIGPRSKKRSGGYTRIYKFGFRYGDAAPMAVIELVDKSDIKKFNKVKESKSEKNQTENSKVPQKA